MNFDFVGKENKPDRSSQLVRAVLQRDRQICQCCYQEGTEVHHIHWLCYGGTDKLNNAICLCHECHRWAPIDPDEFYDYQKRGGIPTVIDTGFFVGDLLANCLDTPASEINRIVQDRRLKRFEDRYNQFSGRRSCQDVRDEREAKFLAVVEFFKAHPETTFSKRGISTWESSLLEGMTPSSRLRCVERAIEKGIIKTWTSRRNLEGGLDRRQIRFYKLA